MRLRSFILTGMVAVAGSVSCEQSAEAESKSKVKATPTPDPKVVVKRSTEVRTEGFVQVRHFKGNLTLERAVEIALRQNPEILLAIQDIQRTRGLIIEVRSQALPQITLTGSYDQTDPRLLEGGGGGAGAAASNNNAISGSLAGRQLAAENSQPVVNTNTAGTVASSTTTSSTTTGSGTATTTAVRALRHPVAAVAPGNTVTNGSVDSSATSTTANADQLAQTLAQIQNALATNNSRSIQDKSWAITVEARQVIYAGGAVRSAINIAKFTQDSAYYQLRDSVDLVIAEVREQFYLVLLNRALITVSEEALRLAEEQLTDQKNRFEAGTVPRFNVLRAEVDVANVRPNLIRAKNDYLLSQIQLAKRLGLDPGPNGKPEFYCVGEMNITNRKISLVDALALGRARRPFLKVQRQQILIDSEQIKVELAGYKPRFDANGGYEVRNDSNSDDLSKVVNGWFFGVTGTWNIFDGFRTYGRVQQARSRLEQSKINYDDSVHQVELEVESAYANLEQARQTVESQQKNVESALEAVRLAQERFSAGAGTQLEILDARVALTQSRTTEFQARSDFNRDMAELDRVTATQTKYHETFHDPMEKVEKGIFARLANTGLPKISDDAEPAKH